MTQTLKKRIMWRVYVLYVLRRLFNPVAVKLYILAVLFWQGTQYVSVFNVWDNVASRGMSGFSAFLMHAVMHTEVTVQVMLAGAALVVLWACRDLFKRRFNTAV